jgi:hypothetical protein
MYTITPLGETTLAEWVESLRQRRREIETLEAAYDAVKRKMFRDWQKGEISCHSMMERVRMDKGLALGEARVTVPGKVAQGVPLVWGAVGAAVAADADWVSTQARVTPGFKTNSTNWAPPSRN